MSKNKAAEVVGWYGTIAIVSAYFLVSFEVVNADSWQFQLLNLTGAAGIIIISALKGVRQSVVLNAFWAAIALLALVRLLVQ